MNARTEFGVWRVLTLLVAFGSGIAALILGGSGALLLTFLGLFASFMAGMVFDKDQQGGRGRQPSSTVWPCSSRATR